MKRNLKKKIFIALGVILLLFGLYTAVHISANDRLRKSYGEGFQKNPLGDYTKNVSNAILAYYEAPLFQTYTNLSVNDTKSKVALLIWVPLYGGEKEYGVTVTDDEKEMTYQIEVDEHLQAIDKEDEKILKQNADAIERIKAVIKQEWHLDFD